MTGLRVFFASKSYLFQTGVLFPGGFREGLLILTQCFVGEMNWEPSRLLESPNWPFGKWRSSSGTFCSPLPTAAEGFFWAKTQQSALNAQKLRDTHGSFLSFSTCNLQTFFRRLQHRLLWRSKGRLLGVLGGRLFLTSGSGLVGMCCMSFTEFCLYLTSIEINE